MAGFKVIGQTGSTVLSDEKIQYRTDKKRAVRYWIVKVPSGYRAEVVGPFHSKLYGTCSFATSRKRAKQALADNLARNFGHVGTMFLSAIDEADKVGTYRPSATTSDRPISKSELVGSAGQ